MSSESPMADTASNDALDHFRSGDLTVGVVGLGYVGLPLSVEIARAGLCAVGFDINPEVEYLKYNGLAEIYLGEGRFDEAERLLQRSLENYPYDDAARLLMKRVQAARGQDSAPKER